MWSTAHFVCSCTLTYTASSSGLYTAVAYLLVSTRLCTLQPLKFGRLLPSEASAGSTEPQEDDDEGALQEGKDNRWVSARLQEQAKNAVPRPTRGNILEPGDGPLVVHEY